LSDGSRRIARKLKLSEPIHDAGRKIEELEFERPKARLFRLIENLEDIGGEQILSIIADLCDIGSEAVDEMDWEDITAAGKIVGELLNPKKKRSRPTSKRRKGGARG
jgi:hypothetical protein